MNKLRVVVGAFAVGAILVWYFFRSLQLEQSGPEMKESGIKPTPIRPQNQEAVVSAASHVGSESVKVAKEYDAEKTIQQRVEKLEEAGWIVDGVDGFGYRINGLRSLLDRYFDSLGNYPDGGAEGVSRALFGENGKGQQFVSSEAKAKQVVTDQYGDPFRFTFGTKKMNVRSARQVATACLTRATIKLPIGMAM